METEEQKPFVWNLTPFERQLAIGIVASAQVHAMSMPAHCEIPSPIATGMACAALLRYRDPTPLSKPTGAVEIDSDMGQALLAELQDTHAYKNKIVRETMMKCAEILKLRADICEKHEPLHSKSAEELRNAAEGFELLVADPAAEEE